MTDTDAPVGRDLAVIGLWQMGRGIARNLDRAGRLGAAWDLSGEALQAAGLSHSVALTSPDAFGAPRAVVFVVPSSTEIRAVLAAAREGAEGRVIAVMQPHRYTRLQALMEDFQNAFNDADVVMVTPVYPAGEEPIDGVDSAALVEGLRAHGHRMVSEVADLDGLCRALRDLAADGDMIICMGAGDITKWAAALADGICAARAKK